MAVFKPPVSNFEISGIHTNVAGTPDRTTLIITDSVGNEFTLTVEAAIQHDASVRQGLHEGDFEDAEPVYVVPGFEIDPSDLERIIATPAELLMKYLVEQVDQEPLAS